MTEFSTELLEKEAQQVADELYAAIQHESNHSGRSLQAQEFRVGVSDLGFCHERVRRMLDQQVPEDTDALTAWIGTWLGTGMESAAARAWPQVGLQQAVSVTLQGETREYTLTGHPDIIDPVNGRLLDAKTDYGLADVEKAGPNLQQQFQRHMYAKGAWLEGWFGDLPLEEVKVGNVWMDRAGIDKRLHVHLEPYDESYVEQAATWLDDVVYAYLHQEEAQKDPPREMCAVACGFFRVCRAFDTDVEGLLTAPEVVRAAQQYREGQDLESRGKHLKDQSKVHLKGISGSTGEFLIRWTHVNASLVPETQRRGYDRLEVKPIPKRSN